MLVAQRVGWFRRGRRHRVNSSNNCITITNQQQLVLLRPPAGGGRVVLVADLVRSGPAPFPGQIIRRRRTPVGRQMVLLMLHVRRTFMVHQRLIAAVNVDRLFFGYGRDGTDGHLGRGRRGDDGGGPRRRRRDRGRRRRKGERGGWGRTLSGRQRDEDVAHLQLVHFQSVDLQCSLWAAGGPALAVNEIRVLQGGLHFHLQRAITLTF